MDGIHPHTFLQQQCSGDRSCIVMTCRAFFSLGRVLYLRIFVTFSCIGSCKASAEFFRFNCFQSIVFKFFQSVLFICILYLFTSLKWQMLYFNPFSKYSCCSLDSLHFFCLTHCLAFDFWDRRTFCNSCIQDFCNAQLHRWNNTIWKPGLSSVWLYLCFLYFHWQLLTAQNGSQVRPGCVCVFVLLYLYIFTFVNVINVQLRP